MAIINVPTDGLPEKFGRKKTSKASAAGKGIKRRYSRSLKAKLGFSAKLACVGDSRCRIDKGIFLRLSNLRSYFAHKRKSLRR
jgi:hypothetical protein